MICPTRLSKYSIEVRRRRKSFDDDGGDAEKIPSSVQYEPLSRTVFCELDWVPNTCSASSGKSVAQIALSLVRRASDALPRPTADAQVSVARSFHHPTLTLLTMFVRQLNGKVEPRTGKLAEATFSLHIIIERPRFQHDRCIHRLAWQLDAHDGLSINQHLVSLLILFGYMTDDVHIS